MSKLRGVRVAVLATDGFEESDLTEPVKALREAGARPQAGTNAWGCPQLLDD
jgi:putative intracellular protease/amidase